MPNTNPKPNYIHTLQGKVRDAHALTAEAQTQLCDVYAYLCSEKFHTETWVDVKDVLRRLEPVNSTLSSMRYILSNDTARRHHFED